jgi:hypothetical protein
MGAHDARRSRGDRAPRSPEEVLGFLTCSDADGRVFAVSARTERKIKSANYLATVVLPTPHLQMNQTWRVRTDVGTLPCCVFLLPAIITWRVPACARSLRPDWDVVAEAAGDNDAAAWTSGNGGMQATTVEFSCCQANGVTTQRIGRGQTPPSS